MSLTLYQLHRFCGLFLIVLATQHDLANAVNNDPPSLAVEECCACGHAMYSVEFQGLWSRNTHPKGFPDEKNSYQLHWSNVVGATHGGDYRIWDYGHYASRAVKEVCEFGSSRSLENEMKENSDKIRTVIKTKQLWGPEAILDSVKAVYTASKEKHLLSLITMIGPSPDWCLGISAHSMCTSNCTWVNNLSIDLYPWDSGTDSRKTYLGRKTATEPPEPIHRLNSTYPKDVESPFYGVDLKPFARLTITKNKETCTDDDGSINSAENSPTTEELVNIMKKNMMMNKKLEMEKCATSLWGDWSECSNPCGNGTQERRRTLKNPGITVDMCDLQLEESQSCTGDCKDARRKKLHDSFVMRHDLQRDPTDMCAVTGWSDWSPCSSTCGLGMKERWRMFLHGPEKRINCGIHLMEKDLCRGQIPDCQKAMMMKNFTAICQLAADVGPCRGNFPRWFYNHTVQKCHPFTYGGCRGNENRFETEDECVTVCAEHMADVLRTGQMSKQEMMEKQLKMEKQKMIERDNLERQRIIEKENMMEKQRMMEKDAMMEKQRMMEKDAMMEKQRMMEKDAMMEKQRMMEKQGMMEKEEMMEKQGMMEKEEMMEKQRMMEKQGMMEKEEMMEKQRMMEKSGIMDKEEMMEKQRMMEKEEMMEKQRMMEKEEMMEKQRMMEKQGMKENEDMDRHTMLEKEEMMEKQRMIEKEEMMEKQKMMENEDLDRQELIEKEEMMEKQRRMEKEDMDKQRIVEKEEMMEKQRMMEKEEMIEKQKMMENEDLDRQKLTEKEEMMEKQRRMEKEDVDQHRMMEKEEMMNKQQMMEKQRMIEEEIDRQKTMEKEEMMEKQRMMEEEVERLRMIEKEEMMDKQRMMERNEEKDDKKNLSPKKTKVQKHGQDEKTFPSNGEDGGVVTKGEMTRKQQAMLTKKQNRKRLREKQLQVDYDEDENENNVPRVWGPTVDCVLTPWSDWSECSVTCGVGVVMKTRMVKVEPQNGGSKCQGKLIKKKKCRQRKCAIDCMMSEWEEWSPCSETCGNNAVKIRKRHRLQKPLHGGLECPTKMEKKFCNVPMCTGPNVRNSAILAKTNIY